MRIAHVLDHSRFRRNVDAVQKVAKNTMQLTSQSKTLLPYAFSDCLWFLTRLMYH